jgi:molybdopterin-guanine dinucleotide biosynthesis protein B
MGSPPVLCIVGRSDSGKTTLIEKLIPEFIRLGFRVGTVKHGGHGSDIDRPGKDSWRHLQAGSAATVLSSQTRIGLVKKVDHDHTLDELMPLLSEADIVLAEGFKQETRPKIEVFRSGLKEKPLDHPDHNLIAYVSDLNLKADVPVFALEDAAGVVSFLIGCLHLKGPRPSTPNTPKIP